MSLRLNMYGFSLGQMRRLFRSRDEGAVRRIRDRLAGEYPYRRADEHERVGEIVERAVTDGVPFPDLGVETYLHSLAAAALAGDEQEWFVTDASHYHSSALEDGLWKKFGKYARPETKAFLRGLVEGVPLFGQMPSSDDSTYTAVSLEKLRFFQAGLSDLREQVTYRIGRKKSPSEGDEEATEFLSEFCGWVGQIVEAERDLWFSLG